MSEGTEEPDFVEARQVLAWRAGSFDDTLPTKGGPKFFGCRNALHEENKANALLNQYEKTLSSRKVRKLLNLGQAEWLPDRGVAKITKQGKFMQHMGHHEEFFALYPEEALFLLDIGDLELTFHGIPLSLQEGFAFVLDKPNAPNHCTLGEYQVYAQLARHGYIVQRFSHTRHRTDNNMPESSKSAMAETKETMKRKLADEDNDETKLPKTEANNAAICSLDHEDVHADKEINGPFRDWLETKYADEHVNFKAKTASDERNTDPFPFPNLADNNSTYLPKPHHGLIPANTIAEGHIIEEIWFQRIKRDTRDGDGNLEYSHSRKVDLSEIGKKARSWSTYKQLLSEAKNKNNNNFLRLLGKMQSGRISPLLHPSEAVSLKAVMEKIRVFKQAPTPCEDHLDNRNSAFAIKFNVYRADPTQPFKKTNPGTPFIRVAITDVSTDPPDFKTIRQINAQSGGVPVKYAINNCGQVSFLSFDDEDVPNICDSS